MLPARAAGRCCHLPAPASPHGFRSVIQRDVSDAGLIPPAAAAAAGGLALQRKVKTAAAQEAAAALASGRGGATLAKGKDRAALEAITLGEEEMMGGYAQLLGPHVMGDLADLVPGGGQLMLTQAAISQQGGSLNNGAGGSWQRGVADNGEDSEFFVVASEALEEGEEAEQAPGSGGLLAWCRVVIAMPADV